MIKRNISIIFITLFISMSYLGVSFANHVTSNIPPSPLPNNPERHAWNDVIGWIDFGPEKPGTEHHGVEVTDSEIKGFASSSVGFIGLNCNSTPIGNDCTINWKVTNDTNGNLSGWAWNDNIGWISFDSATAGSQVPYQVKIVTSGQTQGDFKGWAWNDVVGWISFNCDHSNDMPPTAPPHNVSTCIGGGGPIPHVDYKVKTTWAPPPINLPVGELTSSIFDTCTAGTNCGASLNTITWLGTEPSVAGNYVKFQIATNCSIPKQSPPDCLTGWNFIGPNGFGSYYVSTGPDTPLKISDYYHRNKRYFRYKIFLDPCNPASCSPAESPVVEDIIINWSP